METMFLLGPDGRQRRIYNGVEVKAEPEVTKRLRRAIFKAKQVD